MQTQGSFFEIAWTVVPGNNAFVIPLDTTRRPLTWTQASIAAGGALLAPGTDHHSRFAPAIVIYTVKCTGQNVTVDEQVLTGNAGTSADWETQGVGGTFTVTAAAAATQREFIPVAADYRLLVTAGATGPTTLIIRGAAFPRYAKGS